MDWPMDILIVSNPLIGVIFRSTNSRRQVGTKRGICILLINFTNNGPMVLNKNAALKITSTHDTLQLPWSNFDLVTQS